MNKLIKYEIRKKEIELTSKNYIEYESRIKKLIKELKI